VLSCRAAAQARQQKADESLINLLATDKKLVDVKDPSVLAVLCALHKAPILLAEYESPCSPHRSASVSPGGVLLLPTVQVETGYLTHETGSKYLNMSFDPSKPRAKDDPAHIFVVHMRESADPAYAGGHYEPLLVVSPLPYKKCPLFSQLHPLFTGRCAAWMPVVSSDACQAFVIPHFSQSHTAHQKYALGNWLSVSAVQKLTVIR
jgi:hypothetical protein